MKRAATYFMMVCIFFICLSCTGPFVPAESNVPAELPMDSPMQTETPIATPLPRAVSQQSIQSQIDEPDLAIVKQVSPDGKYCMETYGVAILGGWVYPEGIRLVEMKENKVLWDSQGGYANAFIWSPNSAYVAVNLTMRTYNMAYVLDVNTLAMVDIPEVDRVNACTDMITTINPFRLDTFFSVQKWIDDETVEVQYKWNGEGDSWFYGAFDFNIKIDEIANLTIDKKTVG